MLNGVGVDAFGTAPAVLSVTQLNNKARMLLERNFTGVAVAGEISNLKLDRSGHRYFVLKDAGGVISAAMFRREVASLNFPLKDGVQVVVTGNVTVYGPSGRYQLVVNRMMLRGAGQLQAAFEELKNRLAAEGLFASERKRRLPLVPQRVAVITSPHGAVLRDILHVSARRFPNAQILVVPTRTQGAECAPQVVEALARLNALAPTLGLEVIIVARGGGSLEDLWGFNDERVARAIAASRLPVVSAVGHETDFTIADFVADVRAPTPSAAAELVFPQKNELYFRLQQLQARLTQALRRDVGRQRFRMRALRAELGDGKRLVYVQQQRLSHAHSRMELSQRRRLAAHRQKMAGLDRRLAALHPRVRLQGLVHRLGTAHKRLQRGLALALTQRRERLIRLAPAARLHRALQGKLRVDRDRLARMDPAVRLRRALEAKLRADRERLVAVHRRLEALSPLGVLRRGYGIVLNAAGHAVRNPQEAPAGTRLDIRVAEGRLTARVEP